MSPFQIALNLEQRLHTTRGRILRGRCGLVPKLPKRGLVVPKVFTPKVVSLLPKGDGLWAFGWGQSGDLSPFINIASGPKHKKTIFDTSAFAAQEK